MSVSLKAKVQSNRAVGPGVHLITLAAPAIAQKARPGQFVMLRVSPGAEPLLARPFSIHGVEGDSVLVLYQVVGRGTGLLKEVVEGQELVMWGPLGRGFELSGAERPVLVGGGMGMAPLGFAAGVFEKRKIQFRLLSGGASREAIQDLVKSLEGLLTGRLAHGPVAEFPSLLAAASAEDLSSATVPPSGACATATEDGSYGEKGLVTLLLQNSFSLPSEHRPDAVLTCGPIPMLKAVAALAHKYGVPCQVSLEAPMACGVGACLGCAIPAAAGGYVRACQEGPVMDAELVDWGRM